MVCPSLFLDNLSTGDKLSYSLSVDESPLGALTVFGVLVFFAIKGQKRFTNLSLTALPFEDIFSR